LMLLKKLVGYLDVSFFAQRLFFFCVSIAVIIIIFSAVFSSSEHLQENLYQNIKLDGLSSIEWLKNNSSSNDSVVASPWHSLPINFFGERRIYSTPITRAGQGNVYEIKGFFEADCNQKKVLLEKKFISRIVFAESKEKGFNCNFFEKVYDEDNYSVFLVRD